MFDLSHEVVIHIGQILNRSMGHRVRRDCKQTVISLRFTALGLFGFDGADQSRRDNTARKRRRVHEHENIKRIAVLAER